MWKPISHVYFEVMITTSRYLYGKYVMSSPQRQIINTDIDDLEEITELKFKIDMNLLFKVSNRSKVNMNYILKFRLSLI